jgi:glycine oxidase
MLDVGEAPQALDWAGEHGHRMRPLDAAELHAEEPALALGKTALWMPEIGQVRNPRLAKAARGALEAHDIKVLEHTEVTGLQIRGGRVHGVETDRGKLAAERVIVAGGAWSAQLLGELGVGVEVEPVKGQMILYRAEPDAIRHIVLNQGKYVIPRRDGHILAGSTLEYVGFDKRTTEQALQELKQVAEAMFPMLVQTPVVTQWAGLRPGSPEGLPYIGEHPRVGGLYVNAGHFRNGVVLGPASARLMADLVLGRPPILEPGPYGLEARRRL